jgi:hypothetical protein
VKYLPWGLLAIALVLGYGWHRERQGELKAELKLARQEFSALQRRMQMVDTVYVRDTVRLSRIKTRYDTLLVDVRTTDTVWVRRFVQVADSTILVCSEALNSCGARVAVRDSMLFNLRRQVDVLKKKPRVWDKLPWVLGGVVVGKLILK